MKINKKIALIALACVVVGAAALFTFNHQPPTESGTPAVSDSSQAPNAHVNDVTSPEPGKEIDPSATSSSFDSKAADVIDPEKGATNITVPLTDPVQKPPADPNKHEKGDESEPPKSTAPPASKPKPAPAKPNEPQSGATNEKGQVWVPGFGWVTPGGGNKVLQGKSDGDINKQVGDM
ncbi:DUF6550 family protein [Desulfosporosinus lacus]|uniref:Uncharacterized protein n=1 Tax=Desulfosporosinus lacus DSM 15449 TaxID=1121420 RepID=A0A1M5V319_9FIRM|nr:DUF6550 family protein [Desulfosporosinus lacus]SHH69621.1 hypothetical protein SAMN02746098_01177 [Desulfosporosinus lacus DSM 15449]